MENAIILLPTPDYFSGSNKIFMLKPYNVILIPLYGFSAHSKIN